MGNIGRYRIILSFYSKEAWFSMLALRVFQGKFKQFSLIKSSHMMISFRFCKAFLVGVFMLSALENSQAKEKDVYTLLIDVGNSRISCGVYTHEGPQCLFSLPTKEGDSSAVVKNFFEEQLEACGLKPRSIAQVGISSVVPRVNQALEDACKALFSSPPYFLTGLSQDKVKIIYRKPEEVGSDLIAGAIAATERHPGKDVVVVDFGTATTVCAVNAKKEFLGAVIFPGLMLSMEALTGGTALLKPVEVARPKDVLADSTAGCIQAGLYYAQIAGVKAVSERIRKEYFKNAEMIVVGTGGFSYLFREEAFFTEIVPSLNLEGILAAMPTEPQA